ncbi:hypothetical protein [Methylobacterium sp. 77]|uniref:hypothetical protein n=1 Tax=Methylobacterium sp. 77 TaxID=1101192 RepID=UPI0012DE0BC0|nr:hypothetical protein [Methylobacterium sp. 77]
MTDLDNPTGKNLGFAEAHNKIFEILDEDVFFIIINPDCIATAGCIDALVALFEKRAKKPGIVEGRQWPYEHPKEYDPFTLETPWASGAFALINSEAYRLVGGMDERFFMYMEDVDLSWAMWNAGFPVYYEPASCIIHFSGGRYYRPDLLEREKYYSLRNFPLLLRKFFGDSGEIQAWTYIRKSVDPELVKLLEEDVQTNFADFPKATQVTSTRSNKIKVLGLCQFHEIRK